MGPEMTFAGGFLLGISGSVHCVALCGVTCPPFLIQSLLESAGDVNRCVGELQEAGARSPPVT